MTSLENRAYDSYTSKPEPGFVESWRTPGRTRALIATYFVSLTLALVFVVAALWWFPFAAFHLVALVTAMIAWSMLRMTIRMKDAAPRADVDGYEQSVLDHWRARSLRVLSFLLYMGGLVSIIVGTTFSQIPTAAFAVAVGLYMMFSYFTVTTLPAIGFALTFNRPAED